MKSDPETTKKFLRNPKLVKILGKHFSFLFRFVLVYHIKSRLKAQVLVTDFFKKKFVIMT